MAACRVVHEDCIPPGCTQPADQTFRSKCDGAGDSHAVRDFATHLTEDPEGIFCDTSPPRPPRRSIQQGVERPTRLGKPQQRNGPFHPQTRLASDHQNEWSQSPTFALAQSLCRFCASCPNFNMRQPRPGVPGVGQGEILSRSNVKPAKPNLPGPATPTKLFTLDMQGIAPNLGISHLGLRRIESKTFVQFNQRPWWLIRSCRASWNQRLTSSILSRPTSKTR